MKVNIMLSFSGNGGVEKMAVNLMKGFVKLDKKVTLYRIKDRGMFVKRIPREVNLIQLPSKHTFLNLPYLIRLFKKDPPDSLLVMKERAGIVSLLAKKISNVKTKIFIRFGTHITRSLDEKNMPIIYKKFRLTLLKKMLPMAHGIIAVSNGVKRDIAQICPDINEKIKVIPNPVITDELYKMANKEIQEEWLERDKKIPVITAMGRLTYQKGFDVLLHALSIVKQNMDVKLIIIGDGELKSMLLNQAFKLRLQNNVKFLGFKENPYPYIKNSDLFVLSSRWEGSPNALTEALALGVPCVSTDCETGPREILQNGKLGPLVEVDNHIQLAEKIIKTLKRSKNKDELSEGVRQFNYLESAKLYLDFIKN